MGLIIYLQNYLVAVTTCTYIEQLPEHPSHQEPIRERTHIQIAITSRHLFPVTANTTTYVLHKYF